MADHLPLIEKHCRCEGIPMFRFIRLTCTGLVIAGGLAAGCSRFVLADENDLFSEVRAVSVYDSATAENGTTSTKAKRITNAADLTQLLSAAGFEAAQEGARVVTTKKSLDTAEFAVRVAISEDEFHLVVSIGLTDMPNRQVMSADELLNLMEASLTHAPSQFVYSSQRNRLELLVVLKNQGATGQSLRDEINRLALLARDTEDLWKKDSAAGAASPTTTASSVTTDAPAASDAKASAAAPEASAPSTATPPTAAPPVAAQSAPAPSTPSAAPVTQAPAAAAAPPAAAGSAPAATSAAPPAATGNSGTSAAAVSPTLSKALNGRWTAVRSKTEAFAVQFETDGTFRLAYVNNGKTTTSTGRFSLNADRLTLTGTDGVTMTGAVNSSSDSEFQFVPVSGAAKDATLTFRKAGA